MSHHSHFLQLVRNVYSIRVWQISYARESHDPERPKVMRVSYTSKDLLSYILKRYVRNGDIVRCLSAYLVLVRYVHHSLAYLLCKES